MRIEQDVIRQVEEGHKGAPTPIASTRQTRPAMRVLREVAGHVSAGESRSAITDLLNACEPSPLALGSIDIVTPIGIDLSTACGPASSDRRCSRPGSVALEILAPSAARVRRLIGSEPPQHQNHEDQQRGKLHEAPGNPAGGRLICQR